MCATSVIFKQLLKVSNRPKGEKFAQSGRPGAKVLLQPRARKHEATEERGPQILFVAIFFLQNFFSTNSVFCGSFFSEFVSAFSLLSHSAEDGKLSERKKENSDEILILIFRPKKLTRNHLKTKLCSQTAKSLA
jgi:hypothetical protein